MQTTEQEDVVVTESASPDSESEILGNKLHGFRFFCQKNEYWVVKRILAVTFAAQSLHGEQFQGLTEVLARMVGAAGQSMQKS